MPQKKDNLPVKADVELQNGGTITYANEVIATIAGVAANEVDGIAGMCISGGFSEILSRNRNITRGVKVEVGSQEAAVDLYIIVEYGKPIQRVAADVQENVRKALESLTGLHVVRVDVHVQGVSFEKEKKATQTSIEAAQQPILAPVAETPVQDAPVQEAPAEESQAEEKPVDEITAESVEADAPVLSEEAAMDEEAPEVNKAKEACPCEEMPDAACVCDEGTAVPAEEPEQPAPAAAPVKKARQSGNRKHS